MRKKLIIPLVAVVLLCAACDPYYERAMKGTLYNDSTLSTPLAGATLNFYEGEVVYRVDYADFDNYLGQAVSDAQGRWAFQYIHNFNNPYQQSNAKMSKIEYGVLITCNGDTLYVGSGNDQTALKLYPGCWHNPFIRPAIDSTQTEGGDQ